MSRKIAPQNTYKKGIKLVAKQGWDLTKVREVIYQLQTCEIIDPNLRDHALAGEFKGFRECHIYGDLVIIYKRNKDILSLYKIGRHQDLFKNY